MDEAKKGNVIDLFDVKEANLLKEREKVLSGPHPEHVSFVDAAISVRRFARALREFEGAENG